MRRRLNLANGMSRTCRGTDYADFVGEPVLVSWGKQRQHTLTPDEILEPDDCRGAGLTIQFDFEVHRMTRFVQIRLQSSGRPGRRLSRGQASPKCRPEALDRECALVN